MADNKGLSDLELRALGLLAAGGRILNAQGPTRANSVLETAAGERHAIARMTMARLRDMGLIKYVAGHTALALITVRGRRLAQVP